MSTDALDDRTCGGTIEPIATMKGASPVGPPGSSSPAAAVSGGGLIWNGMIAPLMQMRFAGVLWYQGESNWDAAVKYVCSFPALITDWRAKLGAPKLPFYYVVLSTCLIAQHWYRYRFVNIRNAQLTGGQKLANTAYAVAVDIGDKFSPAKALHPRRKLELGRRLALAVLKGQYGHDVVAVGPVFDSVAVDGKNLRIIFASGTALALYMHATADSNTECTLSPFDVSSSPSEPWVRAGRVTIVGSEVILQMPARANASATTAVRYGWTQWAQCALYNNARIAATRFCWTGTARCPVVG